MKIYVITFVGSIMIGFVTALLMVRSNLKRMFD